MCSRENSRFSSVYYIYFEHFIKKKKGLIDNCILLNSVELSVRKITRQEKGWLGKYGN